MRKLLLVLAITITYGSLYAQYAPSSDSGVINKVTVTQDERITVMARKRVTIAKPKVKRNIITTGKVVSTKTVKVDRYGNVNMPGYKVQVISSTDRSLVYGIKSQLYKRYPLQKQTVISQVPFFKLRIGNFTSKAEAEKLRKQLAPSFPNGITVVPDIVEARIKLPSITKTVEK